MGKLKNKTYDDLLKWSENAETVLSKILIDNTKIDLEEISELIDLANKIDYRESKLSKYGDLFDLDQWSEMLECGCVNYYDGSGYFANKTLGIEWRRTDPMSYDYREFPELPITHVVWFNK